MWRGAHDEEVALVVEGVGEDDPPARRERELGDDRGIGDHELAVVVGRRRDAPAERDEAPADGRAKDVLVAKRLREVGEMAPRGVTGGGVGTGASTRGASGIIAGPAAVTTAPGRRRRRLVGAGREQERAPRRPSLEVASQRSIPRIVTSSPPSSGDSKVSS